MKNLMYILFAIALLLPACQPKEAIPTADEIEQEKAKIKDVIMKYNKANEEKNFKDIMSVLSDDVIFFGTDSSEIITNIGEFKNSIDRQWLEYESIKYGDLRDVSIQIDPRASVATIIFGVHADLTKHGVSNSLYLRVARILKKKNDKWLIVSGIVGIVRSDLDAANAIMPTDTMRTSIMHTK